MNKQKVKIIHLEILELIIDDPAGAFIVAAVDFPGDKDLLPGYNSFGNCSLKAASDADFITRNILPCR